MKVVGYTKRRKENPSKPYYRSKPSLSVCLGLTLNSSVETSINTYKSIRLVMLIELLLSALLQLDLESCRRSFASNGVEQGAIELVVEALKCECVVKMKECSGSYVNWIMMN